jgi:hypothetical protein
MAGVGQQNAELGRQHRYYSRGERNEEHSDTGEDPRCAGRQQEIRGHLWQTVGVDGPSERQQKYCREAVTDPASQCQSGKPTRVGRAP